MDLAQQADREKEIMSLVIEELDKAEKKHPHFPTDVIHASAIIAEEAGELSAAALQVTYENGDWDNVLKEAVQTTAMGIRFLLMFDKLKSRRSGQEIYENDIKL